MDDLELLTAGRVQVTFPVARNDNIKLSDVVSALLRQAADDLREAAADCAVHNAERAQRFITRAREMDELRRRHG